MTTSSDLEHFSDALSAIYDASLDNHRWPQALQAMTEFVGASAGMMGAYDFQNVDFSFEIQVGYEPYWLQLYRDKYIALNPLIPHSIRQPVGQAASITSAGLYVGLEGNPMYEEWVKPQGILDVAEVILDRSMTTAATLAITRKTQDGYFDAEGVNRVQRLFPHVRRAVLIGQVLKRHRRSEDDLAKVIEGLAAGVFLVTKEGRILRSNETGDRMLSAGSPVRADGNVLRFPEGAPKRAFAEVLKAAAGGPASLGDKGVSIPLNGGTGFVAHILPLKRDTASDTFHTSGAQMAVFIRPTNPDQSRALETLARNYKLTPAESRVARALVEVGSTPMIAEALGVTVATVRTHVRNLYQKTGCGRQSEIVSLLQGLVSPFG